MMGGGRCGEGGIGLTSSIVVSTGKVVARTTMTGTTVTGERWQHQGKVAPVDWCGMHQKVRRLALLRGQTHALGSRKDGRLDSFGSRECPLGSIARVERRRYM